MFILRLLGVLVVIAVAAGIVAYLLTRNTRWLRFSWQVFRFALIIALLVFALLILERTAVIPF